MLKAEGLSQHGRAAGRTRVGPLLADLHGKPVIQHTYENVHQSGLFDRVIIVTDNSEIEAVVLGFGGDVVRSQKDHQCGSDRIAEAVFVNAGPISFFRG